MRILYIVQHFSGPSGSGGARAFEAVTRLSALGHKVVLLCGRSERRGEADIQAAEALGVEVLECPVSYGQDLSYARRLIVFRRYMRWAVDAGCRTGRPDVVFASSTPLTVGEVGRKVAAYHRCPFVFEVRDLWPEVPVAMGALRNPVLRASAFRMARRIYGAADHVVALSPDMERRIVNHWGMAADRTTVIPNCSDTEMFGDGSLRSATRASMGWEGQFVCIHPGAMGRVNGLDYLIDAAKSLDARGIRDVHIALLGDGSMREHLATRLKREGVRAARLYDPVPRSTMPAVLAAADVGVVTVAPIPFLETNSANKFFDFLAAGMPVLVNYGGWQAELLEGSGAGLSVSPHHPDAFASALLSLRDAPERRTAMGRAARALAENRFDRTKLVGELEQVLLRVAGCRPEVPA